MRNSLIIYNVMFLLVGNALYPSIHNLLNHGHNDNEEIHECQKCIIIDSNNSYSSDSQELNYLRVINIFSYEYFSLITLNIDRKYLSRAPPIS